MENELKELRIESVNITSFTVNWRGCVSEASFLELRKLNILRKKDLKILSSRAVIGGVTSHRAFQNMTSSSRIEGRHWLVGSQVFLLRISILDVV